jgi:hypothetical protein
MTGVNAFLIAALIGVTGPALAETVTCSTSFHEGYRFCDDGHGHRCIEWERDPAEDLVVHPPPDPDNVYGACPMTPQEEKK